MYKIKNRNLLLIVAVIAMAFVINGCAKDAPTGVVASVNGEDIKTETYDKEYSVYEKLYINQLGEDVLEQVMPDGRLFKDQLKNEVLSKLIMEKIIFQDAKEENIEVSDQEIDEQMEATKENMGGQEELDKFLEEHDMDKEYFKDNTRRDIMLKKHKENFIETYDLKDKEVKTFFEENKENLTLVKARNILVESKEEGEKVLKKLKDGEAFEKLAQENSKDQNTALLGGDMGLMSKGQISEEFDEVVFNLKEGEVSPLIPTETGFNIVEVVEKKDTYESLKTEVSGLMKQNKYDEHVEKLEEDAKIVDYTADDEVEEEEVEEK